MFKKFTLVLLCALFFQFESKAQFSVEEDSLYTSGFVGASSSDFIDLFAHTYINNPSKTHPDTIVWERLINNLPSANWTSAVCDINLCHGTSISTSEFILDTNSRRELSFHFYPTMDKGLGKMVVRFSYKSNPSSYIDVVINCQGYALNINTLKKANFTLYPNPANDQISITSKVANNGDYKIVNLIGETVLSGDFENGQPIDISKLSKGIYCITVSNGSSVSSSKLVIE